MAEPLTKTALAAAGIGHFTVHNPRTAEWVREESRVMIRREAGAADWTVQVFDLDEQVVGQQVVSAIAGLGAAVTMLLEQTKVRRAEATAEADARKVLRRVRRTAAASAATAAERKAKERADKRTKGLRPGEVWAHPDDWPTIRDLEAQLRARRGAAPDSSA